MKMRLLGCIILFVVGLSTDSYAQKDGSSGSNCTEVVNVVAYTPTVCLGESIQLTPGVGGNTFNWSPTTGILDLNSGTPMASPTKTTTYTVTGYANGTCSYYTFTLTVEENGSECNKDSVNNTNSVAGSFELTLDNNLDIRSNGKVIIGDSILRKPETYRLFIQEGILAEKINLAVKETADWADYVFTADYPLRSIEATAAFIKKNKHLPNIPSAETIKASGIDVAKINAKLLQHIEELWLHFIEINKANKIIEQQNVDLEKRIKDIRRS